MPTKHIDEQVWRLVEKKTVEAVVETKISIKPTEMLKWLILKGLENINEDDYLRYRKSKNPGNPG
jgi:hypothetical protein